MVQRQPGTTAISSERANLCCDTAVLLVLDGIAVVELTLPALAQGRVRKPRDETPTRAARGAAYKIEVEFLILYRINPIFYEIYRPNMLHPNPDGQLKVL